jgi:dienelactone hydrolase
MTTRLLIFVFTLIFLNAGCFAGATREVIFTTRDSVSIYGTLYTPETQGKSPGLVLLHMLRQKRKDWDDFARDAVKMGFVVLAIDLRGHGQSVRRVDRILDPRQFSNAEFAKMVEDVRAAVEGLRTQEDVDDGQISLVGASLGANLALKYAAIDPAIRSVVLLSPGLNYRGITTEDAIKAYGNRPALLIAARDDDYSSDSVVKLAAIAKGSVKKQLYEKAGHGNFMFRTERGLGKLILEWLESAGK